MTPENKVVFVNRLKSLLWRTGMMVLAIGLKFALENLGLLELNPSVVTVLGLVLGEISKYINIQIQVAKAAKAKKEAAQFAKALR